MGLLFGLLHLFGVVFLSHNGYLVSVLSCFTSVFSHFASCFSHFSSLCGHSGSYSGYFASNFLFIWHFFVVIWTFGNWLVFLSVTFCRLSMSIGHRHTDPMGLLGLCPICQFSNPSMQYQINENIKRIVLHDFNLISVPQQLREPVTMQI